MTFEERSVFDSDGTWLGRVGTPEGFTVLRLTRDAVLGVQRDSLDVEHFQVLRIDRPTRSRRQP